MTAPNIVNVVTINGKSAGLVITASSYADILLNPSGSGKVLKVTSLIVSNVDGTNNASVNVRLYKNQANGFRLAHLMVVPAKASIDVLAGIVNLEENDSIQLQANADNDLEGVISWDDIS